MKQYPFYQVDSIKNFTSFLERLKTYGDNPAVETFDEEGNKTVKSFAELVSDVALFRGALRKNGIDGKHVALACENGYEWLVAFLGIVSAGGTAVCLDIEQEEESFKSQLIFSDSEAVFASGSVKELCTDNKSVKLFDIGCGAENAPFLSFIEDGKTADCSGVDSDPENIAAIMFTSGTTDKPKAVMLSHRALLSNMCDARRTLDPGKSIFTGLPMYHAYGLVSAILSDFVDGSKIIINGNMRYMFRDLEMSDAETLYAVPLICEVLYKNAKKKAEELGIASKLVKDVKSMKVLGPLGKMIYEKSVDAMRARLFGNLKMIVCGGAHSNPDVSSGLEGFGITYNQGYGITECSPLVSVGRNKFNDRNTVGTVLPGFEVKFENGEIYLKGPSLMTGYYKNEEATAEVLKDGWFRTGDIGNKTSDGLLQITGRCKNLIVLKNGNKISPETLEMQLAEIPMVEEARVFGAPSGKTDDDVTLTAIIYPKKELTVGMNNYEILCNLQNEITLFNDSNPTYKHIKMISLSDTPLEKTSSSKLKRN